MEKQQLKKILEGSLLAAGHPLKLDKILALFSEEEGVTKEETLLVLEQIKADCQDCGYELREVGSGWRFQVRQETAPWVNRLWEEKPTKYSRALLETLALIAYRQPITRGDIEQIRGVSVSSQIIKTLTEREWVKVVGHRDVPGRPSLYATTRQFLDYFNLSNLEDLPPLSEISDLEKLIPELDLDIPEQSAEQVEGAPQQAENQTAECQGECQRESQGVEPQDSTEQDQSDAELPDGESHCSDALREPTNV